MLKVDYAQEEAIAKYGKDPRNYLINAREIVRKRGRLDRSYRHGSDRMGERRKRAHGCQNRSTAREKAWKADSVVLAMGFLGPEDTLAEALKLTRDARTNIAAENFTTSKEGVFVAGDMHSGQSLVVRAINEGQQAAAACHAYLDAKSKQTVNVTGCRRVFDVGSLFLSYLRLYNMP